MYIHHHSIDSVPFDGELVTQQLATTCRHSPLSYLKINLLSYLNTTIRLVRYAKWRSLALAVRAPSRTYLSLGGEPEDSRHLSVLLPTFGHWQPHSCLGPPPLRPRRRGYTYQATYYPYLLLCLPPHHGARTRDRAYEMYGTTYEERGRRCTTILRISNGG